MLSQAFRQFILLYYMYFFLLFLMKRVKSTVEMLNKSPLLSIKVLE